MLGGAVDAIWRERQPGAAFDPKETVTNGGFRVGQFAAARKFLEPATT